MRAMLLLVCAVLESQSFRAKGFRLPAAAELLSLCVAKEKVTKEKGHPAWRLPGLLPGKSVSRGRAFRAGILPARKGIDISVDARYAACRPRLTAAQGTPVEQRAIVARTPQKSWSGAKASARGQEYGQTFHHPSEMRVMWEWFGWPLSTHCGHRVIFKKFRGDRRWRLAMTRISSVHS
ncbi:MAG: hypothetical protein ACTHJO_03165 [Rhodanobacter sp.]